MALTVKLRPPTMDRHLTLSGWFRAGFSRIFSQPAHLCCCQVQDRRPRSCNGLEQGGGVWGRGRLPIYGARISQVSFLLIQKNWNLSRNRAGWGVCQVPSLRKLMFSLLVSPSMKLLALEGFSKPCPVSTSHSWLMISLSKRSSAIHNIYAQVAQER